MPHHRPRRVLLLALLLVHAIFVIRHGCVRLCGPDPDSGGWQLLLSHYVMMDQLPDLEIIYNKVHINTIYIIRTTQFLQQSGTTVQQTPKLNAHIAVAAVHRGLPR